MPTDRIAEHQTATWVSFNLLKNRCGRADRVKTKSAIARNRPDGSTLTCYRRVTFSLLLTLLTEAAGGR